MEINDPNLNPNPNHPAVDLLVVNDDHHKEESVVNDGLNKLQLDQQQDDNNHSHSDSDDNDDDFTFMCVINDDNDVDYDSVTTESDKSGTNRPVFPLFDQSLLLSNENGDRDSRLTSHVPVNKVFIETSSTPSSSSTSSSTICSSVAKEEPAEINIKSNSTGFSKLWRFRNGMNRSNSDGRDAYVFLQSPNNRAADSKGKMSLLNDVVGGPSEKVKKKKQNDVVGGSTEKMKNKKNDVVEEEGGGEGKGKKVAVGVVKKGVKVKKSAGSSAHEVYLKQKGGRTEEERRRSYLPYRPGLMGFFTNVNGGLSKNVHPF